MSDSIKRRPAEREAFCRGCDKKIGDLVKDAE